MSKIKRIFVDCAEILGDRVGLSILNQKYVYDVLRLKAGDRLIASSGSKSYFVRLQSDKGRDSWAQIEQEVDTPSNKLLEITLAFGCVRPDPMEQILRHGAELGVGIFVPILFERCSRRPQEKKQRWDHIITSACSQSGRFNRPQVHDPTSLADFLGNTSMNETRILLSASPTSITCLQALDESNPQALTILVGPEGGLTTNEIKMLENHQFAQVTLCPTVLRTETAAIAGSSIAVCWAMERERRCSQQG